MQISTRPGTFPSQNSSPLLILAGDGDKFFPISDPKLVESIFKEAGVSVEAHYYAGGNHGLTGESGTMSLFLAFLAKYVDDAGAGPFAQPADAAAAPQSQEGVGDAPGTQPGGDSSGRKGRKEK